MEIVSLPRWSRAKQRVGAELSVPHLMAGHNPSMSYLGRICQLGSKSRCLNHQCPVQVHTSSSQTQPQASQQQPCLPCVWFSPRPSRRRLPTFAHNGTRCSAMPDWHQFVGKHVHLHVVRAIDLAVSLESASPAYAKLQTSGSEPVAGMRRQAHVDKTKVPIRDG